MKVLSKYIISLLLLVSVPVAGMGITVFHHHCSLTNEDVFSISKNKLCNCHHDDDHSAEIVDCHCPSPLVHHAKHTHLHTKAHCSHCNSHGVAIDGNKHCCETTSRATSPSAVFYQFIRYEIVAGAIATDRIFECEMLSSYGSRVLYSIYEPPPNIEQHSSIIDFIHLSSRSLRSEDSDSNC